MQDASRRHYRFGPYRLDARTRELRRGDEPVALTARAFDVLLVLIEHRDRVVGRDELLSTVWAGRVVEENNLTQAIAALRRAFGTGPQDHRYIVTVPGRGYQFVAELEDDALEDAGGVRSQPASPAPAPAPGIARRTFASLPVALGLAVLALLLAWWRPRPPAPAALQPVAEAPVPDAPRSLAVLPFRALAGGPQDELLGLGLADTLITRISTATALRVRPLPSAARFADAADPVESARELGVDYLVEGSTQRLGEAVKVNARLLDADGRAVWSGTYDASLERIFTLQDRIAGDLAEALAVKVATATLRSPCDGEDAAAYRAYLAGQYRMARPSAANTRLALADFRRALDLDPTCARAHAAMANAYRSLAVTADADPRDVFPRAEALVQRALAIAPRLPEAHLVQGWIHFWYHWDWAAAEASFRQAIALNPSLADAHFGYAHLMANLGREEQAAALAREALALDPLSPVINAIGGWFIAGRAHPHIERALELDPDYWLALLMRGTVRVRSGDVAGGLADLDRARVLCGDCSHARGIRATTAARGGDPGTARAILHELEAAAAEGYSPPSVRAGIHAALGEHDAALGLLERAWQERDVRMTFLRFETERWRALHGEPRFQALVAAMNFDGERALALRTDGPGSPTASVEGRSSR